MRVILWKIVKDVRFLVTGLQYHVRVILWKIVKDMRFFVTDMWISLQHWFLGEKERKREKWGHFYFRGRKSVTLLEDSQVLSACPYCRSNTIMKTLEWWRVMACNPFEKWVSSKLCITLPLLHHREHTLCALLNLRRLMSYIYIYGAPILDVSRSHTTTQHSR